MAGVRSTPAHTGSKGTSFIPELWADEVLRKLATTAFSADPVQIRIATLVDALPDLLPEKVWKLVTEVHSNYSLEFLRVEVKLGFSNGFLTRPLFLSDRQISRYPEKELVLEMPRDLLDEWRVDTIMRCGQ